MGKGKVTETSKNLDLENVVVDAPVVNNDWSHVFAIFNLDPAKFVVVDDTVKCSTWQQSARTKDGDRDSVQLYSYSARFCKLGKDAIRPEVIERWREELIAQPVIDAEIAVDDAGTYVILVADPQLGKKGTTEAVDNWRRGLLAHLELAKVLLNMDVINAIHVAFMGDEFEGVANNYGNQSHTIELNQSQQIELAYDMEVWTLKEVLKLGLPVSASAVISNHAEWTRNGSKEPVTTQNDNGSTHLARQVKKLFDELEPFTGQHIDWHIGNGHPGVTINLSGVKCYFSHGYIEKGKGPNVEVKTKTALERQILGRTDELGDVDLWFMAHYHHFYSTEFEGRTLFGCPALEAEKSSEYMLDQYGVWSPPGLLGLVVGESHHRDGWSHLNVF